MGDDLTLEEAIAIKLCYVGVGYPTRSQKAVMRKADKVVSQAAEAAVKRIQDGICTRCWGDGFNRVSSTILSGPCEACDGTGAARPASDAQEGR